MNHVNEILETIQRRYNATDPITPLDNETQLRVAAAQGAIHNADDQAAVGASVDLDKVLNRTRDRLTPAQLVPLAQFTLQQNTPLRIPLPREVRQVVLQNNTDQGSSPTNVAITVSLDGTPAGAGDYLLRVGAERAWDVYARELYLFQNGTSAGIPVNNPGAAGIVVLVAV